LKGKFLIDHPKLLRFLVNHCNNSISLLANLSFVPYRPLL
jgi:hypothetical protein